MLHSFIPSTLQSDESRPCVSTCRPHPPVPSLHSLPRLPLFYAYYQARTVSGAAHLFAKIRFDFDFRANEHLPFGRFLKNGGRTVSWQLANEASEVHFSTDTPSLTFCR